MRYLVCLAVIGIGSFVFVMVHRGSEGREIHPPDSEVQPEEYAVYSALVQEGQMVLNETSVSFLSDFDGGGELLLQQAPNLKKSTVTDYLRKNAKTYPLSGRFTTRVTLVAAGKSGTGRENAVAFFSRVGFDSDRSQALVHVGSHCTPACADDYYSVLARNGKEWKVAESVHLRTWN